jgi:phospholipase C
MKKRVRFPTARALWLALFVFPLAVGCGAGIGGPRLAPTTENAIAPQGVQPASVFGGGKITHVVVIMQENRSFDNLFHDYPGADTVSYGYGHGTKYELKPMSFTNKHDISHSHIQFLVDYDGGKGDGFNLEFSSFKPNCENPNNEPSCWNFLDTQYYPDAFSFVPQSETKPYWTMAHQYALGDHTFASNNGPSYVAHQYMIAGESNHVAENPYFPTPTPAPWQPWGCDANPNEKTTLLHYGQTQPPHFSKPTGIETPGPFPCFFYNTVASRLDAAKVSWGYYAPAIGTRSAIWSAFDAIWRVRYGEDWYRNVKSPETRIFNDIATRNLPSVAWVVPSLINSDHAGSLSATGPDWVGSIVNAVGESPYWKTTAIVVMWDEWGGWFDHVRPQQYPDPQTHAFEGLGFRVPALVISPYAKAGYISHTQHEIASSLHLIEAVFGLRSLGGADARADAFNDMFDFSQKPIAFKRIPTRLQETDFLHQAPSKEPPDD